MDGKILLENAMYPKNKAALLEAIYSERQRLEQKVRNLTHPELVYPGSMGVWSVKDILQHLVDWEQRWISWYEAGKRGEAVSTPGEGYNWNQMGLLNEKYRLKYLQRPLADVFKDFSGSYQQILSIIVSIPEDEMLSPGIYPWTGKLPLMAWISGNTCDHYKWATQMIHPQAICRKMQSSAQDNPHQQKSSTIKQETS